MRVSSMPPRQPRLGGDPSNQVCMHCTAQSTGHIELPCSQHIIRQLNTFTARLRHRGWSSRAQQLASHSRARSAVSVSTRWPLGAGSGRLWCGHLCASGVLHSAAAAVRAVAPVAGLIARASSRRWGRCWGGGGAAHGGLCWRWRLLRASSRRWGGAAHGGLI